MDQKIKTFKFIHLAMVAGVTLAYFFLGDFKNIFNLEIDNSDLPYSFIPAIAYVFGNILFRNTLKKIDRDNTPDEKLAIYQTASIMRWAVLEGACFAILFLKPKLLLFGVILLVYMILTAPRKSQILQTLGIKNSEI